jgi:hypothetical protein
METSAPAQAQAFLREIEREQAAALAAIRESLRQFAHAEYWYMRGGVEYFALLIMTAPDLEDSAFTIDVEVSKAFAVSLDMGQAERRRSDVGGRLPHQ